MAHRVHTSELAYTVQYVILHHKQVKVTAKRQAQQKPEFYFQFLYTKFSNH